MRDNKKEKSSAPTDNQIYAVPANQFSPSAGTTLIPNSVISVISAFHSIFTVVSRPIIHFLFIFFPESP